MFTKIKKSIWFKLALIFWPIFVALCLVLGAVILILIVFADSLSGLNKAHILELNDPISSISEKSNMEIILLEMTNQEIDNSNNNSQFTKANLKISFKSDISGASEVYLFKKNSNYTIDKVLFDNSVVGDDTGNYVIHLSGSHKLQLEITYSMSYDSYRNYKGFYIINNIPSSKITLSDNFKVKNIEDLNQYSTKISIVTKNSRLRPYTQSERIPFYQFYQVLFIFTIIYTVFMTPFTIIVFTKARKERKLAIENNVKNE